MKQKNYLFRVLSLAFVFYCSPFSSALYGQNANSLEKIRQYVTANQQKLGVTSDDASTLFVTSEYTDASTGIHHVYAAQRLSGLTITGSNFSLHTNAKGQFDANQMVSLKAFTVKGPSSSLTSAQAVTKLMDAIEYKGEKTFEVKTAAQGQDQVTVFKRNNSPIWDIPVRLVYYSNERVKVLQPAWEVQMMDVQKSHYWLAYVDAVTGAVLEKKDLILKCSFGGNETDADAQNHKNHKHQFVEAGQQLAGKKDQVFSSNAIADNKYRVYDMPLESPGDTIQQPALHQYGSKAGDPLASPDGWHRVANSAPYPYTRGNNVWAFQDPSPGPLGGVPSTDPTRTAYNNGGSNGTPSTTEPFIFNYPVDLANEPASYQNGAIVNLFYWNNLMHDVFYNLGFTEPAGNFEDSHIYSNGTRPGGMQGDAVLAQAQDGGGTNNANFLTTLDGTPGQMQMYLWTASFPDSIVQIKTSSTGIPPANAKFNSVQGSFGTAPTSNTNLFTNPVIDRPFVLVKKNSLSTVGTDEEGCSTGQMSVALPPSNDVSNKIVLIYRGGCAFTEKVLGAQNGGASGVIVINNAPGAPIAMGGTDAPGNAIRIPAVMVSKDDGDLIAAQLRAGATIIGSLKRDAPPAPKRDGDLDNGVIAHEYGHGISTRMTAPNTQGSLGGSEQGGEGWSDFMGLYMTLRSNDLVAGKLPTRSIGNYVTYQPANGRGIRPTPYSTDKSINPSTFKDIGKGGEITVPHGVGYVWATMLYEMMQEFIDQYGMGDDVYNGAAPVNGNPPASAKGNNIAMRLILEGIKIQGTAPTFIRQRDAILRADTLLYGGQHACKIWRAFAKRGLGASAKSNTNGVGDEVEAFDVPLTCDPNQKRVSIVKTGAGKLTNPGTVNYTITVANKYNNAITNLLVTDTLPAGLTFTSASDGGTVSGNVVSWTMNLGALASKTLTLVTQLSSPTSSVERFGDDHELSPSKWVAENQGGLTTWTYTTNASEAYSGSKYWFAPNTGTPPGTNTTLRTANPIAIPANAELVFIHKFSTESAYDGGVVEISQDGGTTYTYLPPTKFVRGGYNGIITTANNPAIGAANLSAFTGTSPGYIVSIARLDDYANKNVLIRFRFTCDQTGGTVANSGWFMDDVYILTNRTEIANKATAFNNFVDPVLQGEGSNASSTSSAFILAPASLPSNLGALTAATARQSVDLKWLTYNEANTATFELERKATGETDFRKIASIDPQQIGASTKTYRYNDATVVLGTNYQYRVKQVNRSGEFFYTNVALVNFGGKEFKASIYPNPADNVANLTIVNPEAGKVTINLFDVSGKRIATFNGGQAVSQTIALPTQQMAQGTYWVEVKAADNTTTLKMIIKR